MRSLCNTLSLLFALVVVCAPFYSFAAPWNTGDKIKSNLAAPQYHQHTAEPSRGFLRWLPQLTWLRNTGLERLHRSGSKGGKNTCEKNATQPSIAKLPAKLLAHYGKDVVLRFNLSTPYEEQMLAEAADHLLLDVWEFTSNWADIRLGEDVVSLYLPE